MARALYIHWPFCLQKCPYCDFNSHVRPKVDHAGWAAALVQDMRHEAEMTQGQRLESIFFGGGTPSLMPPEMVAVLLSEAERLWGFAEGIEITLEANPSSVEAAKFADLVTAGVNRVSLGIQALDDETLQFLGRLHSVDEGLQALDVAQTHFERASIDLIYARPGQTEPQWRSELTRALAFGCDHMSLYQLTIEPNTRFATDVRRGIFTPLADDPAGDLYAVTQEIMSGAGLPAYEVSNHARPGQESSHNLAYWRYHDYVGIGPGAHGRRGGMATLRLKKPENWLGAVESAGHGIKEARTLSTPEQASEALLMGLRLAEGLDLDALAARFSIAEQALIAPDKRALYANLGLIRADGSRLTVTPAGMPLLDALLGELVPAQLALA